jgi:hypothetical protein
MPDGAIWIPGYWIWDDDRDDFVWVTGVARVPPPGQRWVPGYFAEADGGWQRVSGFWVNNEIAEIDYKVTPPPATLETGPSSPAPSNDHFWIPGSWVHYDTGYRWNGGYWAPYQPDWIWVPARWVWTPAGFVYCPGFWDYRMGYRGQMFAPIYFTTPVYAQPGWVYRPWCTIPTNNLFIHLWIRPRWGCYYFGNYYGAQFASRGFVPWANLTVVTRQRYIYDPFYTYAHVHYRRQGVDYLGRVQGWHNHFDKNPDIRPPRTFREQQRIVGSSAKPAVETQLFGRPVAEVARRGDAPVRLTRVDEQTRQSQKQHAEKLREFHAERARVERSAGQVAARTPSREGPGEDRDAPGAKAKGGAEAKAGSLVERAEKGKTREGGEQPAGGRGPKLALPKAELPAAASSVASRQPGGEVRTSAGRDKGPPPKPTPTARASDDRTPRTDRGEKPDRGEKQPAATAKTREGGKAPGATAKTRDDAKAPTTERPDLPRRPEVADQPPTGKTSPGADRGKGAVGRTGDAPQVDRPGRGGEVPRVDQPGRESPSTRGTRPDVGTPSVAPPKALPEGRRPTPKTTPGGEPAGRSDIPRAGPRPDAPGKTSEAPRAAPRVESPGKASDASKGKSRGSAPAARPEVPRNNPPTERGGADAPRGEKRTNGTPNRTEALRPNLGREAPAPMPRVEPRAEARPMPRVEPPREARPMPRVDVPRESRPAPKAESPRPSPNVDRGGGPQRSSPRAERPEPSSSAPDATKTGKGKSKARDNN